MKNDDTLSSVRSDQAMKQVLQAERDAERAIGACEHEARQMIDAAHVRGQNIQARTDQRISNMEMRHDHKLDRLIKDIESQGRAELRHDAGRQYEQDKLQSVIDGLAVELCSPDPGSGK